MMRFACLSEDGHRRLRTPEALGVLSGILPSASEAARDSLGASTFAHPENWTSGQWPLSALSTDAVESGACSARVPNTCQVFAAKDVKLLNLLARSERFELPTLRFEV